MKNSCGIGVLITLPLYVALWSAAEIINDPTGYVMFGVSLMLWPCQWAFDLGRRCRLNTKLSHARERESQP